MNSGGFGIDVPKVGERWRIGDVTVLVTHVRPWQEYDRTVVIARDDNGEDVELRFIPERQFFDDA